MPQPYSHHIFLFPFRFEDIEALSISDQFVKAGFDKPFNTTSYNQSRYFYEFVAKGMFSTEEDFFQIYTYRPSTSATFEIKIVKAAMPYVLDIEKIQLNIYGKFKVGVLAFSLVNNANPEPEDILTINDYGRRIYPQFVPIQISKNTFLADNITLKNVSHESITEDFTHSEKGDYSYKLIPKHISHFIGDSVIPAVDDRMFVCCFLNNEQLCEKLKTKNEGPYQYIDDEFWYQYIFVDNDGPTCKNPAMRRELVQGATNERWIETGTFYGISRYSFVVLAALTDNSRFLLEHLKDFYSEMAILSLAQRACLLNFSHRVTEISKEKIKPKDVSDLYKSYIEFRNRLYFREVTAQEQGIELYDLLQKQMRLDREIKDLDDEITELNQFVEAQEQKNIAKIANQYLPAALVAAVLAFISDKDFFQFDEFCLEWDCFLNFLKYLGLIAIVVAFFFGAKLLKRSK